MGKQDGSDRRITVAGVDDSTTTILHVDMDAFFASVELLDHPELVGQPVIVGHNSARSIVTAATYEARKFGVNSALPMSIALRRCPDAVVLEPHFERYTHFSRIVMAICDDFTPKVERLGIDEAFLDVAGARRAIGSPLKIATQLRARVRAETGLVCSVGGAATKFVAKLASGMAKPDGLLLVPRDDTVDFLHPLPIARLWGVGAKTEQILRAQSFRTIGDLAHAPVESLRSALGDAAASRLSELSWGIDNRAVRPGEPEKSVGHELTFETDVTDAQLVRRELLRMSNMVGARLRAADVMARTVVLKLRFADFSTITRSRTLAEPTDLGRTIFEEVKGIFEATGTQQTAIRLVGVRAEQLRDATTAQLGLWDSAQGWRDAEAAMDAASARFGRGAVTPARLVGTKATQRPRSGQRD